MDLCPDTLPTHALTPCTHITPCTDITLRAEALAVAPQLLDPVAFLELLAGARAESTRRSIAKHARAFCRYCQAHERIAVPAARQTMLDYLLERAKYCSATTLQHDMSAIAHLHRHFGFPAPYLPEFTEMYKSLRRRRPRVPVAAFSYREVVTICDLLDREPNQARAARDRAMLLLGLNAALRRSELTGLGVVHIRFVLSGLEVTICRSKTDQCGEGHIVAVPKRHDPNLCAVRALDQWLRILNRNDGPLFPALVNGTWSHRPLSAQAFYKWFKHITAVFNKHLSPHSLRATNVTWQIDSGASDEPIKRVTRHKCSDSVHAYDRFTNPWATPNFSEAIIWNE